MTRRVTATQFGILLAISAPAMSATVAGPPVGFLGDESHWEFEGAKTFSAFEIRRGLRWDFEVQLASHPLAPRDAFVSTLREKVSEGYLYMGFPDVRVDVRVDDRASRVVTTIVEGPRLRSGEIHVDGAKTVSASRIRAALAGEGKLSDPNHIWRPGAFADFSSPARDWRIATVKGEMRAVGRFFPRFRVDVIPDRKKGTADLAVTIEDEGPAGVIGEIAIEGIERNARDDILARIGLKEGDAIDAAKAKAAGKALERSGRFVRVSVAPEEIPDSKQVRLKIAVVENDGVPPLREALSPAQETLLRLGEWCEGSAEGGSDFAVDLSLDHGRSPFGLQGLTIVLSPREGLAVVASRRDVAGVDERAVILSASGIGLYAPRTGTCCVSAAGPATRISAMVGLDVIHPRPSDGSRLAFQIGTGLNRSRKAGEAPFVVDWRLAPAALAGMVELKDIEAVAEHGALSLKTKGFAMRIDEATGRPLDLFLRPEGRSYSLRGRTEAGAFESLRRRFAEPAQANLFDPERPLHSHIAFAAARLLPIEAELGPRSAPVLVKLIERGVLAPIVEAATAESRREGWGFGCPLLLAAIDRAGPSQSLAMAGLLLADHAFTRGTWPWTLAREAARIAAGHGEYTGAVLIQMYSDSEIGPITCAAFAAALLRAQKSKLAAPFAQRGLADLSTRAFLLDMRPFHVGDSVSARIVRRVCETLRGLTADEIDALVSLFPATDRPAAREVVKRLAAAEESDSRAIPDALRILWEKGLRTRVEGALNGLLRQATAPID